MQPMAWYLGLFISAPQVLMMILLGFSLFNLKIDLHKAFAVALLMGVICYIIRLLPVPLPINTMLIIVCVAILTWLICGTNLIDSFIVSILGVLFYGVLEGLILQVFFMVTDYTVSNIIISPLLNIALFIPILVLILGIYLLTTKAGFVVFDLEPEEKYDELSVENTDKLVIITILLQPLILLLINNQLLISENVIPFKKTLPYINLVIIGIGILSIMAISSLKRNIGYKTKATMLKNTLEQVESLVKNLNSQRHDYGKHIQMIQALLGLEKIEEAKDYLDGITKSYWPNYEIYYTDNLALTALLNTKKTVAEKQGIDFAFAVKHELANLDIPAWDLCSIIGNLLDNAIEAAIGDETRPRVAIEITYMDNYYNIYVFNNGFPIPVGIDIFEPGFTTKGSSGRGYGLYLTEKLINQYDGEIKVNVLKKGATVNLRIPAKEIKKAKG